MQRGLPKFLHEEVLKLPGTPAQRESLVYVPHTDRNTTSLVPAFVGHCVGEYCQTTSSFKDGFPRTAQNFLYSKQGF